MEDDGLFILSSYFLGIEHPPGYPLFTLIGHLFTYLPFGSVAYRVHLASALFGALSGAAAWLCARCLINGRLAVTTTLFIDLDTGCAVKRKEELAPFTVMLLSMFS